MKEMDDEDFAFEILSDLPKTSPALTRLQYAHSSIAEFDPTAPPPKAPPTEQSTYKGKGKAKEGAVASHKPRVSRITNMVPSESCQ